MAATLELSSERHVAFRLIKNGKAIDVAPAHAQKRLQEEATSGGIAWKGQRLLPDLLSAYQLKIMAVRDDQGIALSAQLSRKNRTLMLSECEALFSAPDPIALAPPFLIRIETELDHRLLMRLFSKSWHVTEAEWLKVKEQIGDEVPIEERGEAQVVHILPELKLKDRMGAFADLFLSYNGEIKVAYDDSKNLAGPFIRDRDQEAAWERDLLETGFTIKVREGSRYYCPMDRVYKSLAFLLELGWTIYDAQGKRVYMQKEMAIKATLRTNRIAIEGSVAFDRYDIPIERVVGSFNRRESFINLSDESVGLVDPIVSELPLALEENKGQELSCPRSHLGEIVEWAKKGEVEIDPELKELSTYREISLGEGFKGELYPYQREGVNFLHFLYNNRFGGLLADEMGLGKSVQVLAFFSGVKNSHPHLIVCPTSLLFNWRREIERFLPGKTLYVHHGNKRAQTLDELREYEIVLTSYSLIRQDFDLFAEGEWESAIFDEAQNFKNPQSQLFKAIKLLRAKTRISLSGTPIENRPDDLWSQYAILMPELFPDQQAFNAQMSAAQADFRYKTSLQNRIAPFFLRRKKGDVLADLPERIEQIVWVEMSDQQRSCYEEILMKAKRAESTMEVFEAILRLRQVCCDPRLVGFEGVPSGKLEALLCDIDEVVQSGHKVLVISQFTQMLSLIKPHLTSPYVYLDGQTRDREGVVAQFQEDSQTPLMLMSLKAGGVGLNLTAADYVFLFDPWWNEAVERQAIDRAHRLGRAHRVIAKRYVTRLSIEEKIMSLKESKNKLCAHIMDLESQAHHLTQSDLLELLL